MAEQKSAEERMNSEQKSVEERMNPNDLVRQNYTLRNLSLMLTRIEH
jgi:hypothetical protein